MTRQFPHHYPEECFQAWYAAGRPNLRGQIAEIIPISSDGTQAKSHTLENWREEYNWDARADVLDAKAADITDEALVQMRVEMLKKQAERAEELQQRGLDYLRDAGFDSSASAVNAIIRGADLERVSNGMAQTLSRLLKMSNEQLDGEVRQLLERVGAEDSIIDAEEVKEEPKNESEED